MPPPGSDPASPWFIRLWLHVAVVPRCAGMRLVHGARPRLQIRRDHWTLVRLRTGSTVLRDGRRELACAAPCRWLFPPGVSVQDDGGDLTGDSADFDLLAAAGWNLPPLSRRLETVPGAGDSDAWRGLLACYADFTPRHPDAPLEARPHLDRLICGFLRDLAAARQDQTEAPAWIEDLADWIAQHSNTRLSLAVIARRAGFSPAHVCRSFRRHLGTTVAGFVRAQRLAQAARLLRAQPDLSAAEVARRGGWATPQLLNRAFTRRFGAPPGAWRRSVRADDSANPT